MPPRRNRARLVRRKAKMEVPFIKGHKIVVPNHPTDYCSQPWFSLIVRVINPVTSVTLGELYTAFIAQLPGLSFASATLNVRLHSVRVWGPIPATNTPLRLTVRDIFDDVVGTSVAGSQTNLEVIENFADQVNRARAGYVYSTAQQQKSLFCLSGATDQLVALSGMGNGSVAYFRLLWRPYSPVPGLVNRVTASESDNELTNLTHRSAKLVI